MRRFLFTILALLLATKLHGQERATTGSQKAYPDGHGGEVVLPMGSVSFADSVRFFQVGSPGPERAEAADPSLALGEPDYVRGSGQGFLTLGCGGTVVLEFKDNVLVDIEGPDLHVFEIGPDVEPTALAVSTDASNWIDIGQIAGGRADVDIAEFVEPGATFRYVRLTDRKISCGPPTPGADIDAVAAVGSGYRVSLASSVLFNLDEATLKPEARQSLDQVIERLRSLDFRFRLTIQGHTDASGTSKYNRQLSRRRAQAVWDYIEGGSGVPADDVTVEGVGEISPVASNDTPEGRARNRRVEILIVPRAQ